MLFLEFPNGRWGDSRSPAWGEPGLTYSHYYITPGVVRQTPWVSEISNVTDIYSKFVKYLKGEVMCLPWADTPVQPETDVINRDLILLNESGLLTINSQVCMGGGGDGGDVQPKCNGVRSNDPIYGWGNPYGYVYQKAYVEFFASPIVYST